MSSNVETDIQLLIKMLSQQEELENQREELELLRQELAKQQNRPVKSLSNAKVVKALSGKVSMFSGEDEVFSDWLKSFAEILSIFQISPEQGKNVLPLFLSGRAKDKFQTLTEKEKSSWKELVTCFAKKMKDPEMIRNVKNELLTFRMNSLSLSEYAQQVRKKVAIAYQGLGRDVLEKETIDHLIRGLNHDIRSKVERLPTPAYYEDALNIISKNLRISKEKKERNEKVFSLAVLQDRLRELEEKQDNVEESESEEEDHEDQNEDNTYEESVYDEECNEDDCYEQEENCQWKYDYQGEENYTNHASQYFEQTEDQYHDENGFPCDINEGQHGYMHEYNGQDNPDSYYAQFEDPQQFAHEHYYYEEEYPQPHGDCEYYEESYEPEGSMYQPEPRYDY